MSLETIYHTRFLQSVRRLIRLRVTPLYQPEQWALGVEPEHLLPGLQKFTFQEVSSPVLPWSPLEGSCALFLKAYSFSLQPNYSANVTMTHPRHPQTPRLIFNVVMLHMLCCIFLFPEIHVCFLQTNWKLSKERREFLFQETGIVLNGNNHLCDLSQEQQLCSKGTRPSLTATPAPHRWGG